MTDKEKAVVEALIDIAETAECECALAKRLGEKQGNYRHIAARARSALRYWTNSEIEALTR